MRTMLLALLLAGCSSADESIAETDEAIRDRSKVLDGFFPIAADYQPHWNFDEWKKRGVNTMIRVPGSDNVHDWTEKANALHLKMIREPRDNPKDDLGEK